MRILCKKVFFYFALLALILPAFSHAAAQDKKTSGGINVPVTYYKLPNGLKVVLSPEKSAPVAVVGGSFGSRITANIWENKGYTYSPGSSVFNRYKTGFWYEAADVTTQFTGASIKKFCSKSTVSAKSRRPTRKCRASKITWSAFTFCKTRRAAVLSINSKA